MSKHYDLISIGGGSTKVEVMKEAQQSIDIVFWFCWASFVSPTYNITD